MNNHACAVAVSVWTVLAVVTVCLYLRERRRRIDAEDQAAAHAAELRANSKERFDVWNERRMVAADKAAALDQLAGDMAALRSEVEARDAKINSLNHEMDEMRKANLQVSDRYQRLKPLVGDVDELVAWAERQTALTMLGSLQAQERPAHWVRRVVGAELQDTRERLAKAQREAAKPQSQE